MILRCVDRELECCGARPMLRLDERIVANELVPFVRLVCRRCGRKGMRTPNAGKLHEALEAADRHWWEY